MDDDRAVMAHLLRRATFGPFPGQVDEVRSLGAEGVVERLLAAPPLDLEPPELGTDDDERVLRRWWLAAMSDPAAGLHERMVWHWHGHLTSSTDKADVALLYRQHRLLRQHTLGNFRELLAAITVDAAMLEWLDGDGSVAEAPNENYSREVMELFALGQGEFTEADVQAGAHALAGWRIDSEHGNEVAFDASAGPLRSVPFLGRSVRSTADVVHALCDHRSCAPFVAGRVYRGLVGADPPAAELAVLAEGFRVSGLEIRPLVEAIVRSSAFADRAARQARSPVEWFVAAQAVLGSEVDDDVLDELGQMPFRPPNVAGWPGSSRWSSAGSAVARAAASWAAAGDTEVVDAGDQVGAVLERASLFDVSEQTRAGLDAAARSVSGRRARASVLFALAVCSPEFLAA